jgi:hypothetical protein
MPKTASDRRSLVSGAKVSYRDWQKFKRIAARLRTRHGYSLTDISIALRAERGWCKSAIDYPYMCRPREYAAICQLLRQETKPMGKQGSYGSRMGHEENQAMRRLVRTLRQRGHTVNTIGQEGGMHPNGMSTWLNNPDKAIMQSTFNNLLEYAKLHLPHALIDQAFTEAKVPHYSPLAATQDAPLPQPTTLPDAMTVPTPAPVLQLKRKGGNAPTFDNVLALLSEARTQLHALMDTMPSMVKWVMQEQVGTPIDNAIKGLSRDDAETKGALNAAH